MNSIALLLSLAGLAVAAPAPAASSLMPKEPKPLAQPLPDDPLKTTIYRLSNGLTVYLSPNHELPRVTAWVAVRTGSYNDPETNTGLAHYLEHMLFKGSASLGTLDYAKEKPYLDKIVELYQRRFNSQDPAERERIYKEIDQQNIEASRFEIPNEIDKIYHALGMRELNAFTSDEQTVYVVDMPSNRVQAWAALESDRFAHPVFRLFQSELEAVYEEKNRSMDNAERQLDETVNQLLYPDNPYGRDTLGLVKHLKNPSLESMYDYFRKYYVPNNMAIVMSGDFEPKEVLPILESSFGAWTPKAVAEPKTWPLPKLTGRVFKQIKFEGEDKVVIAWPAVPALDPDADALAVMDMIMDNSAAGIINLSLTQAQRVKDAGSSPSFYNKAGDWSVWAVPKRGQTLEQAESLLIGAVDDLKSGKFSDADVAAVITSFEVSLKMRLESNEARAAEMTDSFIRREPWEHDVERLARLRRVTKADVVRVANKYLGPGRIVVYRTFGQSEIPNIAKPGFTKVDIDASRTSSFASKILSMPAKPIEPRWLVAGRDYWREDSPSGEIYGDANPFDDLFSLSFRFDRGQRQERDLCVALQLLDHSGAGSLSADDFKKKLFGLGTTMSLACGEQESGVTISGLDRNLWPSLELLRERFAAPNIATGTLQDLVDVTLGAHQDNKKDPNAVMQALGDWAKRGQDGPTLQEFSDRELKSLKTEPLKKIIEHVFDYRRRVGYVGNRPGGELARLIAQDQRIKDPPARKPLHLLRPGRPMVYFTHRDMVQARVGVFAADESLDPGHVVDYSYYTAYVGGGMSSVIFQEIREARSLAYSAWGAYQHGSHKGDDNEVIGQLGCQADKTPEAAALLRQLLQRPPFSQQRFDEAAHAIEENYRANPVRFRDVPATLMDWEDQGLEGDPRPQRFQRALSYKLADLEAFSARFQDKPMTVYILGDRNRVGLDAVKKLGTFQEQPLDRLFPY